MVDLGSTLCDLGLGPTRSDPPSVEAALSLPMPVALRAVSATLSAALETVSFTKSAAALMFEADSSLGIEAEGVVSVRLPSPDS
jgi:hypothetical protein